ncbi:hypothetical protein DMC30DRAFT_429470 [Rhodotorula diobovata]|uniref:Uncharacterized protein n=1 Tax=Rhodotorula diobovata TaxID=5288 RepID=A0A5C5FMY6_9BASI|nr:hypothetical protein DMC30DRAFT_429470 [Rhodotorula diobovata]
MGFFHRNSSDDNPPPPPLAPSDQGFPANDKHQPDPPPPQYPQPHPTSSYASTSQPTAPTYAALHLARSDRIRLIGFPDCVVQPVSAAITAIWPGGIQREEVTEPGIAYEYKLKGNPWYGQGSEAVPSRRLMSHVLSCLSSQGWHLTCAVDLSRKEYDKDTLLFRSGPAVPRRVFSVSFNQGDKTRIIDPPSDAVRDAFVAAVSPGATQVKLRGYPFMTSKGTNVNHARLLACRILGTLDELGWELVGSVDISMGTGGGGDGADLDSWFFANKL